jgi:hypothetical protein
VKVEGKTAVNDFPIQLFTLTGNLADQYNWDGRSADLDLSAHPKGIYVMRIQSPAGPVVKKIVLQ